MAVFFIKMLANQDENHHWRGKGDAKIANDFQSKQIVLSV